MQEERRLVWRVLRHWTEISDGGRFPRRDQIDPWMRGEDGANTLLIAVGSPIELSHFVVVGVNLAIALCPTDTLAGILLSQVPRVVSARHGLMIEGGATLRGAGIIMPAATAPVAAPAAISTAASQILRTRIAKPMAVLLLIGRRAARDFAADESLGTESVLVGLIPLDGSPGSHIFKYFIGDRAAVVA